MIQMIGYKNTKMGLAKCFWSADPNIAKAWLERQQEGSFLIKQKSLYYF